MRTLAILTLLVALGAALAGCAGEPSNESGAGTGGNPVGAGEGGDDVDPCDDDPAGMQDMPASCESAQEGA